MGRIWDKLQKALPIYRMVFREVDNVNLLNTFAARYIKFDTSPFDSAFFPLQSLCRSRLFNSDQETDLDVTLLCD